MDERQELLLESAIKRLDKVFKDLTDFDEFYGQVADRRLLTNSEKEIFTNIQTMLSMGVQYAAFLTIVKEGEVDFDDQTEELIGIVIKFIDMIEELEIQQHISDEKEKEESKSESKKTYLNNIKEESVKKTEIKEKSEEPLKKTEQSVKGGFKGGFKGKKV